MTQLRILSDLHLEFGPIDLKGAGEDVIALVGDIGVYTDGFAWADRLSRRLSVPIVMIAGNHEFYRNGPHHGHTVESTLAALRDRAERSEGRVTFLENESATVAGIRFIGATLWTDFALFGDSVLGMLAAGEAMNDYRLIHRTKKDRWWPEDAVAAHRTSRAFIQSALAQPFDGPTVVMTHHLPSERSIAERYADHELSPAYASSLDSLVEQSEAALWLHGHTHVSQDYQIGETRVICNPRGYDQYELNPKFDPDLVVEVESPRAPRRS